jgi:hypothetical protein
MEWSSVFALQMNHESEINYWSRAWSLPDQPPDSLSGPTIPTLPGMAAAAAATAAQGAAQAYALALRVSLRLRQRAGRGSAANLNLTWNLKQVAGPGRGRRPGPVAAAEGP